MFLTSRSVTVKSFRSSDKYKGRSISSMLAELKSIVDVLTSLKGVSRCLISILWCASQKDKVQLIDG